MTHHRARCVEMILERWEGVAKWMTCLVAQDVDGLVTVTKDDGSPEQQTVLQHCAEVLIGIFQSGRSAALSELISLPCTQEFLVTLATHVRKGTQQYEMLSPYTDENARCIVTEVMYRCWFRASGGLHAAI